MLDANPYCFLRTMQTSENHITFFINIDTKVALLMNILVAFFRETQTRGGLTVECESWFCSNVQLVS